MEKETGFSKNELDSPSFCQKGDINYKISLHQTQAEKTLIPKNLWHPEIQWDLKLYAPSSDERECPLGIYKQASVSWISFLSIDF